MKITTRSEMVKAFLIGATLGAGHAVVWFAGGAEEERGRAA
jgi:hypothetical protein